MHLILLILIFITTNIIADDFSKYQIGTLWGKKKITKENFDQLDINIQKASLATIKIAGASGVYLGKYAGEHVVATNHHACPSFWTCSNHKVYFKIQDLSFKLKKFVARFKDLDLVLMTISVPQKDEYLLDNLGRAFAFNLKIEKNQQLFTTGYGALKNIHQKNLYLSMDSDCKGYAQKDNLKFLPDPDTIRPIDYFVWSYPVGCDVVHGDSGSPVFDYNSGILVGIIWSATIPRDKKVQDQSFLDSILDLENEKIWQHLTYIVPASKMHHYFKSALLKAKHAYQQDIIQQIILKSTTFK